MRNSPQAVAQKSRSASTAACAALAIAVAIVLAAAGCTSAQQPAASQQAPATRQASATGHARSSNYPSSTGTAEHWGSFFGGGGGNFDVRAWPATVSLPGKVAEVASSNSTEYALLTNGTLYAWGLGSQGQLGDGRWDNSFLAPVRVRFPAGVKIASIPTDVMPYDSGLAVNTQGHVWGWGHNGGGEFCLGNTRPYGLPVELHLPDVTAVAGASNHALYDSAGTVYACGRNLAGDLGGGSMNNSTTPVRVAGLGGSPVVELVASFANSGALLANGEYFDWGLNSNGQLGDGRMGKASDKPVQASLRGPVKLVAQGGSIWDNGQTLAMLSDGSLWAWGDNRAGQLGDKKTTSKPTPIRLHAPAGVTYQSLATGSATSYALSTTGDVYAWGVSHVGQLGDGKTATSLVPVLVAARAVSISATANNVVVNIADSTPDSTG